jgi:hypothetical protein
MLHQARVNRDLFDPVLMWGGWRIVGHFIAAMLLWMMLALCALLGVFSYYRLAVWIIESLWPSGAPEIVIRFVDGALIGSGVLFGLAAAAISGWRFWENAFGQPIGPLREAGRWDSPETLMEEIGRWGGDRPTQDLIRDLYADRATYLPDKPLSE